MTVSIAKGNPLRSYLRSSAVESEFIAFRTSNLTQTRCNSIPKSSKRQLLWCYKTQVKITSGQQSINNGKAEYTRNKHRHRNLLPDVLRRGFAHGCASLQQTGVSGRWIKEISQLKFHQFPVLIPLSTTTQGSKQGTTLTCRPQIV